MICAEHGGSEKLVGGYVLGKDATKRRRNPTEQFVVAALTAAEREPVDLCGFQIGPRSPQVSLKIHIDVTQRFLPCHTASFLDSFVWVAWCDQDNFTLTNFPAFVKLVFFLVVIDSEPVTPWLLSGRLLHKLCLDVLNNVTPVLTEEKNSLILSWPVPARAQGCLHRNCQALNL